MNPTSESEACHDLAIGRLQQFERAYGHDAAFRLFVCFAVDVLSSMVAALPPDAQQLFSIARECQTTPTKSAELHEASSRCWQAINALDSRYDLQDKTNCAYRAILCCLEREPPRRDLPELGFWFLSFCEVMEGHSDLLADLTDKHFPLRNGQGTR